MTHKHGGNIYEHKNAADFSANINFLGMPDSVRRAALDAIDASIHYPEPGSKELRQILAKRENVSADQVDLWKWCGGADVFAGAVASAEACGAGAALLF